MTDRTCNEPSRVPKQQAFALGWMSHCATDVAGHPFTNAKCGGPYRTHWQRHHVIENHMDALVYRDSTARSDGVNYYSLDTAALHFRLAFQPDADAGRPDDARRPRARLLSIAFAVPVVPGGRRCHLAAKARHDTFDVDTRAAARAHLRAAAQMTMQDVYGGPDDMAARRCCRWDAGKSDGRAASRAAGRPAVLQDMYDLAFIREVHDELRAVSAAADAAADVHHRPRPAAAAGHARSTAAPTRATAADDLLDSCSRSSRSRSGSPSWRYGSPLLPALLTELATWPLRELLYQPARRPRVGPVHGCAASRS